MIENPRYTGWHLGAAQYGRCERDPRFIFPSVLEGALELFKELGIKRELISMGASAVQLGTPFAVTEEGDARKYL